MRIAIVQIRSAAWAAVVAAALTGSTAAPADASHQSQRQPTNEATPMSGDQRAAFEQLQRARLTLADIVERSMSQDAREALSSLSDGFNALYLGYTGHEPPSAKNAGAAAATAPDRVADAQKLQTAYRQVNTAIARMIGDDESAKPAGSAVGTSGQEGIKGIPLSTQKDIRQFREQIATFYRAATGDQTNEQKPDGR